MKISKVSKFAIGLFSVISASGITAYGFHEFSKISIKDKLKNRLLDFGTNDDIKWRNRANLLTKNKENLSKELAKIERENDQNGSKIKSWCKSNINSTFFSDKDSLFLEIIKYCTYNIKDKVGVWITSSWNNSKNNEELKKTPSEKLSSTMRKIKEKLEANQNDALKDWCNSFYEEPFEGENDQNLLDTKNYCKLLGR